MTIQPSYTEAEGILQVRAATFRREHALAGSGCYQFAREGRYRSERGKGMCERAVLVGFAAEGIFDIVVSYHPADWGDWRLFLVSISTFC